MTERLQLEGRVDQLLDEVELLRSIEALRLVSDHQDPVETSLNRVVALAEQVAPGCAIGITTPDHPEAQRSVTRDPKAAALDAAQYRTQSGPCVDASRPGEIVRGSLASWPRLVAEVEVERQSSSGTRKWQLQYTNRSGIGVTADNAPVDVSGSNLTTETLATALERVGAVRATQLDIHASNPTFNFFTPTPGKKGQVTGTKLVDSMKSSANRFLAPDQRDFFAVTLTGAGSK